MRAPHLRLRASKRRCRPLANLHRVDEVPPPAFQAMIHRANKVPSASLILILILILHHDVPGKTVNVHAPLAKDVDAMMSIQYSAIPPGFQAALQWRHKRGTQGFRRKPFHLLKFCFVQRAVCVKRNQGRVLWRVGHLFTTTASHAKPHSTTAPARQRAGHRCGRACRRAREVASRSLSLRPRA